eukprot:SAG31_NODE_362_length_16904_cov_7.893218_7_plen_195_part_00
MGCGASKSTLGSQQHQQNVPLPVAREEQETHVSEIENGRAAECGPKVAKWNGGKVTPAIEADEPALFNTRPSAAKAIASSITAAVAAASTEVGCRKTTEQPHQLSAAERRAVQFDGASSDTDEEAGEEMDSPTGALIARLVRCSVCISPACTQLKHLALANNAIVHAIMFCSLTGPSQRSRNNDCGGHGYGAVR